MARAKTATAGKPAGSRGAKQKASSKATAARRRAKAAPRARKAVAQAKAAGAVGPNGSDAQRALRDTAIVARLKAGASHREVATEFKVSERTVSAVHERRERAPSLLDANAMVILEGMAKDYEMAVLEFQAMAYAHADSNPPVAVAAMKGALAARRELTDLMMAVGKLPANLELFRGESVLRRIADEMMDTMDGLVSGDVSAVDAHAFFSGLIDPDAARAQLPAAA